MFVALAANIWLWGGWSLEKPLWWSLVLFFNSAHIILIYGLSVIRILKLKSVKKALHYWPIILSLYTILILTILLYKYDFAFLITVLVTLKLLSSIAIYLYKRKKKKDLQTKVNSGKVN